MHPHLSAHFNARGLSLMHKRSCGGLLSDIAESGVLYHHGYIAVTHALQSNGLYVSLGPFSQGQLNLEEADRVRTKKKKK